MDNISMPGTPGSQPPSSSIDGPSGVEAQTVENQQNEQPPTAVPAKKRKQVASRSPVWDHFEAIKDTNNVVVKGKCIYCAKIYHCETKKHGTSSLRNHMVSCLKNPHSMETRQSLLTFQAVTSLTDGQPTVGEIGTWVFNQESIRRALVEMIIIDELPFRFVEGIGFRRFIAIACPRFIVPSRWTISRDILVVYDEERLKLKQFLRGSSHRVSITTDSWTSIQRINYMVVTAHFIDSEWKLHKKILAFVPVTSHKGEYLAKALENCLLEWGLRDVFSVTVDNASSNDTAMVFLKKKMLSWGSSTVRTKYLHMRCIAHILNLVVQDGLKDCDSSVKKVREVVRYVRNSPARLKKFRDLADWLSIEQRSSLCLDVPTRWNSTYLMLQSALTYQKVFESLESDCSFKSDLGNSIPDFIDWESVGSLVHLLKCFYDMTIRISGSLYVTSNTFFTEISDLYCLLKGMVEVGGPVGVMGKNMKAKFEKYWGDVEKMNLMIFFANILDPRDKLEYMPTQFNHMYGEEKGQKLYDKVVAGLAELFDDYSTSASSSVPSVPVSVQPTSTSSVSVGKPQHFLKSQIKKQRLESGGKKQTELDMYLSEGIVEEEESFDILGWWKINSARFPVLSKLARDVLAIPISTVASESAFSTSGRVLDPFRSSLTPKIVEALVCTQDWLRKQNTPLCIEENLEELERFEKELSGDGGSGRSLGSTLATIPELLNAELLILGEFVFVGLRFKV
ncbi:PREDICTED: zinc finger BED domain-containing protein RICESLEEPER 2-like [Ipomoea nil]|uniref:zinc finger BED domain-containing protein RICESLEEPER 2-like n=1 Tax=Ipomoea nil TaxID=35883 RepID=UPI000900AA81|nr:PREDICTED: zinc finger BED domain-containing protein RICESLEEPER 2-like [Ipomoea nil]